MGMSASQARLISLTARMNDIEYQGQQINQQRTTLSSQVNALYNNLLAMDVPTPPSTIDYQKVVYSGTTGATKFNMSNVIPTGKNAAGNSTYSIDMSYQMSGHSVSKNSTTVNLTQASEFLYYKTVSDESVYKYATTVKRYEMNATALTELPAKSEEDPTADDIMVKMTVAQYNALADKTGLTDIYSGDVTTLKENASTSGMNDTDIIYVKCNSADVTSNAGLKAICYDTTTKGEQTIETLKNDVIYSGKLTAKDVQEYNNYKSDQQIIANGLYIIENDKAIQITSQAKLKEYIEQGKAICQLADKQTKGEIFEIKNPNYNQEAQGTGLTVGNMAVYKLDDPDVSAKLGSATYADCLEALRNSFPEYESFSDEDLCAKFYVYIETKSSGALVPHFIKRDDIGAITKDSQAAVTYDYDADGTYTKTKKEENCELEFDASTGRIAKVGIPDGNGQVVWVKLEAKTVTDEDAYNKAFNDYEYKKVKYDKEQQEINMQTSIIQAEDKSLELKLTRLDNERNAVNTEIEAVKKVVDDNIQKSFKTFSG